MPHRRSTSCWRKAGPRHAWKVKLRVAEVPVREYPAGTASWTCRRKGAADGGRRSHQTVGWQALAQCIHAAPAGWPHFRTHCPTWEAPLPQPSQQTHLAEVGGVDKQRLSVAACQFLRVRRPHAHRHLRMKAGRGPACRDQCIAFLTRWPRQPATHKTLCDPPPATAHLDVVKLVGCIGASCHHTTLAPSRSCTTAGQRRRAVRLRLRGGTSRRYCVLAVAPHWAGATAKVQGAAQAGGATGQAARRPSAGQPQARAAARRRCQRLHGSAQRGPARVRQLRRRGRRLRAAAGRAAGGAQRRRRDRRQRVRQDDAGGWGHEVRRVWP